jgi:hypothetical protein
MSVRVRACACVCMCVCVCVCVCARGGMQANLDSAFSCMKLVQSLGALFSFFLAPLFSTNFNAEVSFKINVSLVFILVLLAHGSIMYLHTRVVSINGDGAGAGAGAGTAGANNTLYAPLADPTVEK